MRSQMPGKWAGPPCGDIRNVLTAYPLVGPEIAVLYLAGRRMTLALVPL